MSTNTKKSIVLLACGIMFAVIVIWFFGFYPVARVNGEYLWQRAYEDRADALELFESKNRVASGNPSLNDTDQQEMRRFVLQNLITEEVFQQYIKSNTGLAGLPEAANGVVEGTLKNADPTILPRATEELYGWSVEEFKENVLYPQALQNELQKSIQQGGASFEEFAKTQLNNAEVKVYLVPWKWESGGLVSK